MIVYLLASCESEFGPEVILDQIEKAILAIRQHTNATIQFGFCDVFWVLIAESETDLVLPEGEHDSAEHYMKHWDQVWNNQQIGGSDWPRTASHYIEKGQIAEALLVMVRAGVWKVS